MIVDDHPDMRRMIRSIVLNNGERQCEIIECVNGEDAVRQYDALLPDYILMDVQLATMDGFAAAERIYENDPKASIIFVTSHNTSAYRTKAKLLHARGFVSKENLSELELYIS